MAVLCGRPTNDLHLHAGLIALRDPRDLRAKTDLDAHLDEVLSPRFVEVAEVREDHHRRHIAGDGTLLRRVPHAIRRACAYPLQDHRRHLGRIVASAQE